MAQAVSRRSLTEDVFAPRPVHMGLVNEIQRKATCFYIVQCSFCAVGYCSLGFKYCI
jgi:hypothetical protein